MSDARSRAERVMRRGLGRLVQSAYARPRLFNMASSVLRGRLSCLDPQAVRSAWTWSADDAASRSPTVRALAPHPPIGSPPDLRFAAGVSSEGVVVTSAAGLGVQLSTKQYAAGEQNALPESLDLAISRPLHFPQRGHGMHRITADELRPRPNDDDVRRMRRYDRAVLPPSIETMHSAVESVIALAAAGAPLEFSVPPQTLAVGRRTFEAIAAPSATTSRERELRSIRIRRAALFEHRPSVRLHQIADRLRLENVDHPSISVLLPSNRPDDLPAALDHLSSQVGSDIQLLLGLHGPAWSSRHTEMIAERWRGAVDVAHFDADVPLGTVLNRLTERADNEIVTKWDDDDWYGPWHLFDLVAAHEYSGADLVGKAAEFVYLESIDRTIHRSVIGAESYSWTLAGGTFLTTRASISDLGGWPPVPRNVDRLLLDALRDAGGRAYRTHGFQYVLRRRRRQAEHTWSAPDQYFLNAAVQQRCGLDLVFADIEEVSCPRN